MAAVLHRQALVLPADVRGQPNGRLDPSLLRPTKGGDVLQRDAAAAFDAMYDHAKAVGLTLGMTDGYRPFETQRRIFLERYVLGYNPVKTTTQSKTWDGKRWWKLHRVATAAVPGTSNHGLGVAFDLNTEGLGSVARPGPKLLWLAENARGYGMSWELLPEEPWHMRYVPGFPLFRPPAPAPIPPAPGPAPIDEDDMNNYAWTTHPGDGLRFYELIRITVKPFPLVKRHLYPVEVAVRGLTVFNTRELPWGQLEQITTDTDMP